MFSELRFAIPVEISTRPPRKTNGYQRILARSSRICKNHIQTVTTKVKSDKSKANLEKRMLYIHIYTYENAQTYSLFLKSISACFTST